MLLKNAEEMGNYLSDRERDLYKSDKYKKSHLRKLIKKLKYVKDDFFLVELKGKLGVVFEYEMAWGNYLSEEEMIKLENLCLLHKDELNIRYVDFYFSRHKDNINGALIIHAFIDEKYLYMFTETYLNNITEYIINYSNKVIKML